LFGGLTLGGGSGPTDEARRPAGWAIVSSGYQNDFQWLRYRAGIGLGTLFIPPDAVDGAQATEPTSSGWLIGTAGPEMSLGVVLSETWSIALTARAHGSWMVLDTPEGDPRFVPWLSGGLGLQLSL